MADATLFAIDEVNAAGGINGRELVPIHLDPAGDLTAYYYLAKQLLVEHGASDVISPNGEKTPPALAAITMMMQPSTMN